MTIRKREDIGNWTGKHYIVLCGELTFAEVMGLLYGRLLNE
jgi:hypothetical protein